MRSREKAMLKTKQVSRARYRHLLPLRHPSADKAIVLLRTVRHSTHAEIRRAAGLRRLRLLSADFRRGTRMREPSLAWCNGSRVGHHRTEGDREEGRRQNRSY